MMMVAQLGLTRIRHVRDTGYEPALVIFARFSFVKLMYPPSALGIEGCGPMGCMRVMTSKKIKK